MDRTNHHLFQPLLYQVAAGILPPGLIAPALRSIIKRQANARALLAEVLDIDLARREVHTEAPDGRPLEPALRHPGGGRRRHPLLLRPRRVRRSTRPG